MESRKKAKKTVDMHLEKESAITAREMSVLLKRLARAEESLYKKEAELEQEKNTTRFLQQSVKNVDLELHHQLEKANLLYIANKKANEEIERLKKRGLIARILNK